MGEYLRELFLETGENMEAGRATISWLKKEIVDIGRTHCEPICVK